MTTGPLPEIQRTPMRDPASSGLWDRVRTYLIGVGIGVSLLGMFWMMRNRAAQQQANSPDQAGPSNTVLPTPANPSGN